MLNVYVSGPMRGLAHFNFPNFAQATAELRELGHNVFSPAERDIAKYGDPSNDENYLNFSLRDALAADTEWICKNADAIYMLKGWETSTGAFAEWALAKALRLNIFYEDAGV